MALEEIVVRGLFWPGHSGRVILLHDQLERMDVDAWGPLPEELQADGFSITAIDLPGHGLSEGAATDDLASAAIAEVVRSLSPSPSAPLLSVVAGATARPLLEGPVFSEITATVLLSPPPGLTPAGSPPALVIAGAHDLAARAAADSFLRQSRGWTIMSTFGTKAQGHALLNGPHREPVISQVRAFLRDYREGPIAGSLGSRIPGMGPPRSMAANVNDERGSRAKERSTTDERTDDARH